MDEGTRSVQQMQAEGPNQEIRNLKVTDLGNLKVAIEEGGGGTPAQEETTLISNLLTIGTDATSIPVNRTVTNIMVANYSETADLTINDGTNDFKVGPNLALEMPINKQVTNLSITASVADTKVQLVVKGVE